MKLLCVGVANKMNQIIILGDERNERNKKTKNINW